MPSGPRRDARRYRRASFHSKTPPIKLFFTASKTKATCNASCRRRNTSSTHDPRSRLSSSTSRFSPRGVVQRVHVHAVGRKLHVSHHGSADEAVLHRSLHTCTRRCGRQHSWMRPRRWRAASFDVFPRVPCADVSARLRRARRPA